MRVTCPTVADGACRKTACHPKTGNCELLNLPDGADCQDGLLCSLESSCSEGVCTMTKSQCECQAHADCATFEKDIANKCVGATAYCAKATGKCRVNPASVAVCNVLDDSQCLKNRCQYKTGKCALTHEPDNAFCEADGSPCTDPDRC